jgi:glycosyltransferase involved in cell wall biosynthesis
MTRTVKKRILYPFVGDSIGGAQISTLTLIENLDQSSYTPIVILHEDGVFAQFLNKKNIKFGLLPLPSYLGRQGNIFSLFSLLIITVPKLTWFLCRNKIDIVHAQDGRMNLTWVLPAKIAKTAFVWHQRSLFSVSRLLSLGARFATKIVCISKFTMASMPSHLKGNSTIVVNPVQTNHPNLDRKQSHTNLCSKLNISPQTFVVGYFGNLTRQKRPDVFIQMAAETLKNSTTMATFVLFGSDRDNEKSSLIALAQSLEVKSQIVFKDFVSDPELWMAGCDIVIAPAINEGFGRTIVESMLVGTPVIAADSGGHKQIIQHGETGFLVAEDNAPAFAAAIQNLQGNTELSLSISRKAAEEAAARFGIGKHIAMVDDIYRAATT